MAAHNGWVLQIKWHPKIFSEKDSKKKIIKFIF